MKNNKKIRNLLYITLGLLFLFYIVLNFFDFDEGFGVTQLNKRSSSGKDVISWLKSLRTKKSTS